MTASSPRSTTTSMPSSRQHASSSRQRTFGTISMRAICQRRSPIMTRFCSTSQMLLTMEVD